MSEEQSATENLTPEAPEVIENETITPEDESGETTEPTEEAKSTEPATDELALPEGEPEEEPEAERKTWPKGVAERLKREKEKTAKILEQNLRAQEELAELRAQQAQQIQQTQQQAPGIPQFDMPKRENYPDDYSHYKAMRSHEDAEMRIVAQQQRQQELNVNFIKKRDTATAEGVAKYPDYIEKVDPLFKPGFPENRAMAEAIVDSDYKHDMFYFYGKYPEEARRVALLNPIQAVKEIAKLEARFNEKKRSAQTGAKPVMSPVKGGGTGGVVNKDPNKMDPQEYREWYTSKYG